jgi:hypothetical protein
VPVPGWRGGGGRCEERRALRSPSMTAARPTPKIIHGVSMIRSLPVILRSLPAAAFRCRPVRRPDFPGYSSLAGDATAVKPAWWRCEGELVRSYLERTPFPVLPTGSGAEAIILAASA